MKILIVDDHVMFADSLALALEIQGLSVVKVSNGADALGVTKNQKFDLVLLDINLPDVHGEVLLKLLKSKEAKRKVIIVSAMNVNKQRIVELGADGFIHKANNIEAIFNGINTVLAGDSHFEGDNSVHQPFDSSLLSPRQAQIMQAMSEGLTNKMIGLKLHISEGTVKQHMSSVFKLLDVKNRTECLRKARQLGLTN